MSFKLLPRSFDTFINRTEELKEFTDVFPGIQFFYIEGIPGIGKTSLMLKWANFLAENNEYKDKILWIKCQEDWSIDILLTEINDWLVIAGEKSIKNYIQEEPVTREEKFLHVISILNQKTYVIFIDDFHNIDKETGRSFINTFHYYMRKGFIYFISRVSPPLLPEEKINIYTLRIHKLKEEVSLSLLKNLLKYHHFSGNLSEEDLIKIAGESEGHPLLLKSLASLLIIHNPATNEILAITEDIKKDIGNLIFSKIVNKLEKDELQLIELLSFFRVPVEIQAIKKLTCDEYVIKRLSSLEEKILIEKDITGCYWMHSILKEFIYKDIEAHNKVSIHNLCGDYFTKYENDISCFREAFYHYLNAGEKEKMSKAFQKVMGKMCSQGLYNEFMEKVELLGTNITPDIKIMKANVMSITGRGRETLKLLEEVKNEVNDKRLLAEIYTSIAGAYLNMGDFKHAIPLYNNSLKFFRKVQNITRISKITNYLAFIYSFRGEIDMALEFQKDSFALAQKEHNEIGIANSLRAECLIFLEQQEFEKALAVSEECLRIAKKAGSSRLTAWATDNKGRTLLNLNRYNEAWECFSGNLSNGKKVKDTLVMAFSYSGLGDILYEKGDIERAAKFFMESIKNYENNGNYLGTARVEYALALIAEEKDDTQKALNIYLKVMEKAKNYGFPKLEIRAVTKIAQHILHRGDIDRALKYLTDIKQKIPNNYFTREQLEIHLLLAEIYFKKNEPGKQEQAFKSAFALFEKSKDIYGIVKTSFFINKISTGGEEKYFHKAKEYLEKLTGSEKRKIETFIKQLDTICTKRFIVKTSNKEFTVDSYELEQLRNRKQEFDLWIDIPAREAFEKDKGKVDILKKPTVLSVLLILLREPGKKFTSEELYKKVWEWKYEWEQGGTEVRKNISRIRSLIEPDKSNLKYILLEEAFLKIKGKYYFNSEANFCFIEELVFFCNYSPPLC
jgi:tetratricopeptide (TPR) repeat protein